MAEDNAPESLDELIREGYLWPSPDYDRNLASLRRYIGEEVYLVLLKFSDINLAVELENKPSRLLDIIEFPAPDPAQRLYPHMLVLADGRGINLGHAARITRHQAFNPLAGQVIFQQKRILERLLFQERQLSEESIRHTSHEQLARLLSTKNYKRIG